MIAKIVFVVLLIYFVTNVAYNIYKQRSGRAFVYLALYCVVFLLFRNDTLTLLMNNRASYVLGIMLNGFDSIITTLFVLYAVIYILIILFAKGGRCQSKFLCIYSLHSILKLSLMLYSDASIFLIGITCIAELIFLNSLLGLAAYGSLKWYYHFIPFLPEFKESDWFGGILLLCSLGLSIISIIFLCTS